MDIIRLKPTGSTAFYHGTFDEHAFNLLASPAPLLKSLLTRLAPHGANLNSLRIETTALPDANITCSLLELNTAVRVRLDRVSIDFLKLSETGIDVAATILAATWGAVGDASGPAPHQHLVNLIVQCQAENASYRELAGRFVSIPSELPPGSDAGFVFYTPKDESRGEVGGSIVMERLTNPPEAGASLKVNVQLEAGKVGADLVVDRVKEYLHQQLKALDIELQEAD